MYALNLYGVTMGFLITKTNVFVMLSVTRALMSCGWNGRDMINLKTVGWHSLPCYRMSQTWYMCLRLTHQCSILGESVPKRASTAVRDSVLPLPLSALPVTPLHPRQVQSAVVVQKPNSVGVVVSHQFPPPPPVPSVENHQSHHMRRAVIG